MNAYAKLATLLTIVTIAALPAAADPKVVSTQVSGSPLIISTNFGIAVDAVNIGGESLTCDGIRFTGLTVPENTTPLQIIETTPFAVTLSTRYGNLCSIILDGGDALFHSEVYSLGFKDIALLISGLDPKKAYQIQYLHGEFRSDAWAHYDETTVTFSDSNGKTATAALTFNTSPNSNQYALVTVDVTGSESLLYDMPKSANRRSSFSGFVVLQKP